MRRLKQAVTWIRAKTAHAVKAMWLTMIGVASIVIAFDKILLAIDNFI